MKKNKKVILVILLIVIVFSFIGYFILKETYSTSESLTDNFISNNINRLNSILETKIDTTNPYYLNEIVDDNGNVPAYQYYSDISSKSIKKLTAYDNKVFLGLGDWDSNTGPVKILYYDTLTKKIETSGTITDEAVADFKIIDDNLYTTGRDPRDGWGYGSYYVYNVENNNWEKHMHNTGWIHVFDVEKFHDKLFMCGSVVASTERSLVQVSYDNGETFEDSKVIFSDGNQVPYDSDLRAYSFFIYNEELYTRIYKGSSNYNGIYKYDEENNQFNFVQKPLPLTYPFKNSEGKSINSYPAFERYLYPDILNFNNLPLYISGQYLYSLHDLENNQINFKFIRVDNNYAIQNGVVNNDTLYLLSYFYNEDSSFDVRIYRTKDLEKFDVIYEFTVNSFPYSIEYFNNSLYIGTSLVNYIKDSSTVGSLFRIDLDKLEKKLTLNEDNNTIDIAADGNMYTSKYELTPNESIFEINVSFNNSMSQNEWQLEFNKLINMNLLYTLSNNRNTINYEKSVSYFNEFIYDNINISSDYSTAVEFAKAIFDNEVNIQNKRFSITSKTISNSTDEYNVLITLTVTNIDDTVTSEKYIVNEDNNYIYIGTDNDVNVINSNIISSELTSTTIDLENNKLLVMVDEEIIREYKLISFNTDRKLLNKSMYVSNLTDEEVLSYINVINGKANISDNKLQIMYDDDIIDTYNLIRFTSDKITVIGDNKVYIGNKTEDEIRESMNVINADSFVYGEKIKITDDNNVVVEIDMLSINFGEFSETNKNIVIPNNILYDEFINNITASTGITYKILNDDVEVTSDTIEEGMSVKTFYNDIEIDSFNIINEYLIFDENISVDEENKFLSNINFNKNVSYLLKKIDTSGKITVMNNKDEIINNSNLIGTGSRVNIRMTRENYDYLIIVKGDVDGNGILDFLDIGDIANYVYKNKNSLNGIYLKAADYDNNNSYNLEDIMKIARKIKDYVPGDNFAYKIINSYNQNTEFVEKTVGNVKYNLDTTNNLISDVDNNIRYYGSNPNNYIYFNCDTYPNTNCETWRIIGVFDNKVKLIKNSVLDLYSVDYDYNDDQLSTSYSNDWKYASLNSLLNSAYLNNRDTTYYNYAKVNGVETPQKMDVLFKTNKIGIKDSTRDLITEVTYGLGGYENNLTKYSNEMYELEKNGNVFEGNTPSYSGKIAIPYLSDYLYSSDFRQCSGMISEYVAGSPCETTNWMSAIMSQGETTYGLTLTQVSTANTHMFITGDGVAITRARSANEIFPVLYLDSDTMVSNVGDGSKDNPYRILTY